MATIVSCPPPNTAEEPVLLPANNPLVMHTSFLGWEAVPAAAGGAAQMQLHTDQMVCAFGSLLACARTPADLPAARNVNPLNLGLSGRAWTRILTEYVTSGLLNVAMTTREELAEGLAQLTIANPWELIVVAADWQLGETIVMVPATPPVAGVRGAPRQAGAGRLGARGYRAPVAAIPAVMAVAGAPGRPALDAALAFLPLTSILDLEVEAPAPWRLVAYLAGLLGPCRTQAERNRLASQVQFAARALAAGGHRHFSTLVADTHSLALNMRDYLQRIAEALPRAFLSAGVHSPTLVAEGRDAMVYVRDDDGRRSIESSRIYAFGAG